MPTVGLIGATSALTTSLLTILQAKFDVEVFGRDRIDFTQPTSIQSCARQLVNFDYIVNCSGLLKGSPQEILTVNALGPINLLTALQSLECRSRVIMIGSHGSMWHAWPGIDMQRLCYNVSKRNLMDFVLALSHSRQSHMALCVFNPSRFQSAMSDYRGTETHQVAQQIATVMGMDTLPLLVEMESSDARSNTII